MLYFNFANCVCISLFVYGQQLPTNLLAVSLCTGGFELIQFFFFVGASICENNLENFPYYDCKMSALQLVRSVYTYRTIRDAYIALISVFAMQGFYMWIYSPSEEAPIWPV